MKLCVTGALGHIGSSLLRNLSIPNLKTVHVVDNLSKQRYASLMDLPKHIPFVFHEVDINSPAIESIISDSDVVVHLAAISDAESSLDQTALVNKVNVEGLRHIVQLCSKHKTSLVFPSTTSIYAGNNVTLDERAAGEFIAPQSPYAESKLTGERLIAEYARKHDFPYVIFRIGTIYGFSVGMRFNTAVNKFVYQAARGDKLTVWKTALKQKRPYCDLRDAMAAFNHFISNKIFDRTLYNIVTGNHSVSEIIDTIRFFIPDLKTEFIDSRIMNELSYAVSNEKSRKRGLAYSGNLHESVEDMIRHFKNINYRIDKNIP